MKTQFKNIVAYTHQGKRPYQEDNSAYGPQYLLVSDGVGGLAKGDIASGIVVDTFRAAIEGGELVGEDISGKISAVVDRTLQALLDYAHQNEESMGMGATLALLLHSDDQYISVHIGDSRVYHFSNAGEIKWRSTDHSLVQELVTGGIITEEEAATHPRRNVITRVLQAKEDHSTKASITVLENVVEGDVFMVCSDGVTESWSDAALQISAGHHHLTQDFITDIQAFAASNSNDNNTAICTTVAQAEENTDHAPADEPTNAEEPVSALSLEEASLKPPTKPLKRKSWWKLFFPMIFLSICFGIFYISQEENVSTQPNNTQDVGAKSEKKDNRQSQRRNDVKDNEQKRNAETSPKVDNSDVFIIEDRISKEDSLFQAIKSIPSDSIRKVQLSDFIRKYPQSKHVGEAKSILGK